MIGPRIKVCGMTRAEDVREAVRQGADAIGFVLWAASPRAVAVADAARIAAAVPPFVARVGVFVNASPAEVARAVREVGLDAVQLHGDENVDAYRDIGARLIKAVAPDTPQALEDALRLPAEVGVLVDARDPEKRGGTGRLGHWRHAAEIARVRPVILAGGLTALNVAEAIAVVRPWAVDVSSGVEDAPGIKSAARLSEFMSAVRASARAAQVDEGEIQMFQTRAL